MKTALTSYILKQLHCGNKVRYEKPIPAHVLNQIGFQSECQGLIDRYIQVDGAWDEHLALTRAYLTHAVAGKEIENLVVLGSGWLLDLPLEELAASSGHVWLYDAVHPAQVIHRIKKFSNVSAISADITGGGMINAWKAVKQYKRTGIKASPESFCNIKFRTAEDPDYVMSLNVLSQIGIMITSFLQRHIPYTPEEVEKINRFLQQAHLDLLEPDKSCLVTDVREINIDLAGGQAESSELLQGLLPDKPGKQTWEWNFDPNGEYRPGKKTILQVLAMEL